MALAYFHLKSESSDKCKKSLDRARELFELSVDKNDENIVEEWNKNLMYIEQHLNEINDAVVIDTNKTRKLDL